MIRALSGLIVIVFSSFAAWGAVEIQEVETPGGFTAWLVEEHSIPFAAIEFRFRGGTSLDADGKGGSTNLMMGLLEEGSGDMDAQAFTAERERLAARMGFDANRDSVSVSFRFLTENREASAALLKQALIEPAFSEDALERVRAQVLSGLRSDETDPNTIARRNFNAMAWGAHPYARGSEGTIEDVTGLTRDDIFAAHRAAMAKDRVFIGAVGDITADELSALLDGLLSDLPDTGAPLPDVATFGLAPGMTVVDFDTPQSVALFGHEGIARDDPDFFAAYVVSEIFGGSGLESRLKTEVRVKRGLTYGIGSYLVPLDLGAMNIGQVATVANRMGETVDVVRAEWERIASEGITEEELDAAKLFLTGAYPLRFDGNAPIARILVGMQMDDLPIDYIATRNEKVNGVTLEEANRVAERIYRPEALHFVVVGPSAEIPPAN
ncbi:MAG: pitrilysin family protein [Pseudomonadota bacterium]